MKLAVVGSRGFDNFEILTVVIDELRTLYDIDTIVSGGANGADKLAEFYADFHNLNLIVFPADWNKHGKQAGFLRNIEIWDNSDLGVAFWDGVSKGTAHSLTLSAKQNKKLFIFDYSKMDFYLHSKIKKRLDKMKFFDII